jgi:hypothetical protein
VSRGGWIAVLAAAALLYVIAAEARLGYDTAYQLVWGRELLHGALPQYEVWLAPTPHPLQVLLAGPLSLLGQTADEAMRALSLLSLALLAAALYRVGTLLFSPWVGSLAAAVLITRPHLIEFAYLGDADIPAAALAAWAGVLALERRPAAALALLALSGLLRPEAWVLSTAYFAFVARGRHVRALVPLAALAAAAPLLWALSDLAITGDGLWSLHHTRTGTELLNRPTGAITAIEQLPRHLNFLLGTSTLLVGLLGLTAGLVGAPERMWGLVAVLVLLGGSFFVLALAGLSLQPRYLVSLAAAVVVCTGIALLGWPVLGSRWRGASIAGLVLLAGLPFDAAELADVRGRVVDDGRALEALARSSVGPALRDCGSVSVPTIRAIPFLALWTSTEPSRYVERSAADAYVTPTETSESWIGGGEDPPPAQVPPPDYAQVAANSAWRVYARC